MSGLFTQGDEAREPGGPGRFAHVAPERGIDIAPDGLTYRVPPELDDLAVGQRVRVPLGRRDKVVSGYVVSVSRGGEGLSPALRDRAKRILERDDEAPTLTADLVELARWMSGYYCCPLGMVLSAMVPAAARRGTGRTRQTWVGLAGDERSWGSVEGEAWWPPGHKPSRSQRAIVAALRAQASGTAPEGASTAVDQDASEVGDTSGGGRWVELRHLADLAGLRTTGPVKRLVALGVLVTREVGRVTARSMPGSVEGEMAVVPRLELTPEQRRACERIVASMRGGGFSVHLIHGVTGSGKTEVYLRVIEAMLGRAGPGPVGGSVTSEESGPEPPEQPGLGGGGAAVVLVPEIALTPQTARRFVERFGEAAVAVLHSGLTAAQRHEQWRRVREGRCRVVVGARSAVFAPFEGAAHQGESGPEAPERPGLRVGGGVGLIVVDEEHDSSYKQDQLPRYHARDVAVKRGQLLGVPVILGSATPSLESYYNATVRRTYQLHELPERVAARSLPRVEIVDLTQERRKRYEYTGKGGVHLLSLRLETMLRRTLQSGGQALILLNRRGYANYIACPDHGCGWMMRCDLCDVTMVYHKDRALPRGGVVRCHHCESERLLPELCPLCGKRVTTFGLGLQRVEEEIERKIPGVRLIRMDSDTMHGLADYHAHYQAFLEGRAQVLVGTQMIAKGLDFPNVSLVGVISADTSLHLPDFRASERTFQLVSQVAGRAGRGDAKEKGLVLVQTFSPEDKTIGLAARHDYPTFAREEIAVRERSLLPPVSRMARVVVRDSDPHKARLRATELAAGLLEANTRMELGVRVRGPSACPLGRIAGFYRWQIELLGGVSIQRLLTAVRNARLLHSDGRTAVDVDPVDLL